MAAILYTFWSSVTSIELEKYSCDSYSTTNDDIKLRDLNPKVFIRKDDKWQIDEDLTNKWLKGDIPNNDFYEYLTKEKGLKPTLRGYYTEEGYVGYEEKESKLQKEAETFVKEWTKKHLEKKDLKRFNSWYMWMDVANDISSFKKKEWEERTAHKVEGIVHRLREMKWEIFPKGKGKQK